MATHPLSSKSVFLAGTLHSRLRDILVELKSVKNQLEDADESVRYIEVFGLIRLSIE